MTVSDFSIGIDFGTTNTVIALAERGKNVRCAQFGNDRDAQDVFRSVLCFLKRQDGASYSVEVTGGHEAIHQFLTATDDLRFIQSIKSHAASKLFEETRIFGTVYKYEDLMASFLAAAQKTTDIPISGQAGRLISGRPVAFVGAQPDTALANERHEAAFDKANMPTPWQVYEPVGAAFSYAQSLKKDATILVGDFGGGTSDFSIMRFECQGDKLSASPIGYSGLGIAGDRFDYRIIDAVISPKLGKNSQYKSFGKLLEMPKQYYAQFAKWHQLALLKSPETIRALRDLAKTSVEPEQIEALIETIVDDRGFDIYRAVSDTKVALSGQASAPLRIKLGDIVIDEEVSVDDFNAWIAPDLEQIGSTIDQLMADVSMDFSEIDSVFLTGGSSFIPAVQELFAQRFGREKIADGNQFQSVAIGLAMIGLEKDPNHWRAI
jgi:hypothetical chaperone protein